MLAARLPVKIAAATALIFTLAACNSNAKEDSPTERNPQVWQPRTKSVAVFKNGLGFFLSQGPATLRDGWAVAKEIPPAKFGTLAVYPIKKNELVDVVGTGPGEVVEFDGFDSPREIASKRKRLESSLKLKIQLTYQHQGSDRTAAGQLVSVGPDFAVLESDQNNFAVPLAQIAKMQVLELPLRVHVTSEAAQPVAQTEIGIAYLREGITWIPEYSLRILDDSTAELTLRGTLVNEAEDLIHCDVNFVVGVPHFVHAQYMAPIAVGQVIRTLGAAVAPRELQNQIANRAAIGNNDFRSNQLERAPLPPGAADRADAASDGRLAETLGNLPQIDAASGSDYTVYTKKDLTVRRGERAIVTLFVKKIKYSHGYRWTLPEPMKHFLLLRNDTDTAWTTGPCLAISGDQPLSEDLLKYTPRRGHAELPVTASVNVAHEKTEVEADRQFRALESHKIRHLDLVTLNGELKLRNFEETEIDVVIVSPVPGKPTFASDDGTYSTDSTKLELLQREGKIRWKLKLRPDESRVLKYKYERYVPGN